MSDDEKSATDGLLTLRFELGWRWFALRAKQRVSMFNFFILVAGILANAYVLLIRENLAVQAAFLALVAAAVSLAFVLLDKRNKQLVDLGEDLLRTLEGGELGLASELHSRGGQGTTPAGVAPSRVN